MRGTSDRLLKVRIPVEVIPPSLRPRNVTGPDITHHVIKGRSCISSVISRIRRTKCFVYPRSH